MSDSNSTNPFKDSRIPSVTILEHLITARQWEQLLAKASERLAYDGFDLPGHRASALALLNLYRAGDAYNHVCLLLSLNPDYDYHHLLAAQVASQQMKWSVARRHLAEALALNVENIDAHRLMAGVLVLLGETQQALIHADIALQLDAGNVHSWSTREMVIESQTAHLKHWQERFHVLGCGLAINPIDPFLQWRVGRILLSLEKNAAAEKWFGRALSQDPCNPLFISDWRDSVERRNFICRCLSYPWRQGRVFCGLFERFKSQPDTLGPQILAFQSWFIVLIWWVFSWFLIAPIGWFWRYFMLIHPSFDVSWQPRRWLRQQATFVRVLLMTITLAILGGGLYYSTPVECFNAWITLSLIHLGSTAFVTMLFVGARWLTSPSPPKSWLE